MPEIFIKRDDINRLGLTSFCASSPMARAKSNEPKNFVDPANCQAHQKIREIVLAQLVLSFGQCEK
jgi:hypothetical protein